MANPTLTQTSTRLTAATQFGRPGTITVTLPVPPASGGTGTSTVFTPGSIPFAGASGIFHQDNAKLFWDDVNGRAGFGTNVPTGVVHTVSTADPNFIADCYNSLTFPATFLGRRANGTPSAPSNSAQNDILAVLEGDGYDGATFGAAATVQIEAGNDFFPAQRSGEVAIYTVPTGTGTLLERLRIKNDGKVGIGTNAPSTLFHVKGKSTLGTGTYALECTYDASISSASNALVAVLGTNASPDGTGAATAIFEKYSNVDINVNSNATVAVIAKKNGGLGGPNARVIGITSEAADLVGWNPGLGGPQAFVEGGLFKGIGAWTGANRGSVQGGTYVAELVASATDFGFVNAGEYNIINASKDQGLRSLATLDGSWNSITGGPSIGLISHTFPSTYPCDIGISIGNGYPVSEAGFYHGLYIRGASIVSGGNLITSNVFSVAKTGRVTLTTTGVPVYANNAAALAGGLTAGQLYRTGADPDPVCIVH